MHEVRPAVVPVGGAKTGEGSSSDGYPNKRTAVLVVHGMGNQRPLDTMRGIVGAVWTENRRISSENAQYWVHVDNVNREVDLSVLTTAPTAREERSATSGNGDVQEPRRIDFHELYWAHLVTGTRSAAVFLWLFELVRKGPNAKWRALRLLWWLGGIFLALSVLSAIYLILILAIRSGAKFEYAELGGFTFLIIASFLVGYCGSLIRQNGILRTLARRSLLFSGIGGVGFAVFALFFERDTLTQLSEFFPVFVVPVLGFLACAVAMGKRGLWLCAWGLFIWYLIWVGWALAPYEFEVRQEPPFPPWATLPSSGTPGVSTPSQTTTNGYVVLLALLNLDQSYLNHIRIECRQSDAYNSAPARESENKEIRNNQQSDSTNVNQTGRAKALNTILFRWQVTHFLSTRKQCMPWSTQSPDMIYGAFSFLILYLLMNALFLRSVVGDAARYFRQTPENVSVRRAIRKLSLETLDGLHRSGQYDRIIVVAHSLGTVVAYDMLRTYWGRVCRRIPVDAKNASPEVVKELKEVSEAIEPYLRSVWEARIARLKVRGENHSLRELDLAEPKPQGSIDAHRAALRRAGRRIVKLMHESYISSGHARWLEERRSEPENRRTISPPVWLVTDFVTLGSPLTHAAYLMSEGDERMSLAKDFELRKSERELPTSPARLDDSAKDDGIYTFTHESGEQRFHHAALFGITRWTNLYFSGRWIPLSLGDPIGGALQPVFGWGIKDIDLRGVPQEEPTSEQTMDPRGAVKRKPRFFEHNSYWTPARNKDTQNGHIRILIDAIDLSDRDKYWPGIASEEGKPNEPSPPESEQNQESAGDTETPRDQGDPTRTSAATESASPPMTDRREAGTGKSGRRNRRTKASDDTVS